jgi:hypothetical protein
MRTSRALAVVGLTVLFAIGCAHVGPQLLPRDRFDYNKATTDSWKTQTLLNIVRLRYFDMPLFLDVASIVSGYSLESTVTLSADLVQSGNDKG